MNAATAAISASDSNQDLAWRRLLAPYKQASWGRAIFQLLNTAIPFAALWVLMARNVATHPIWSLLLVVPTAFLYTRLFIMQHDCGHGAFFPSRQANNLVGGILGVITLFPYGYWRRTHAIHHATAGNLEEREMGDIHTLTVAEYLAKSTWGRLGYRLYRHPVALFVVGPAYQFIIKHRFPWDVPLSWKREWKSVLGTNLGIALGVAGLGMIFGWQTVLLVHLPVVLVAGSLGIWLFYVQHQFEDTYWDHSESWDFTKAGMQGSSFYDLHPVLHWLTGNIGYHHIHHLSSLIPNYRLPAAFRENPELQQVTRLSLFASFRCARLKLWDEESKSLIGFRELKARLAERAGTEVAEAAPQLAAG